MTISRLASSLKIPSYAIQDWDPNIGKRYLEAIKAQIRHEMGYQLLEYLEGQTKPSVIDLKWIERQDTEDWGAIEIALIASLNPTDTWNYMVVPEMELHFSMVKGPAESQHIPIEWECAWCGQTNSIENRSCPHCGQSRKPMR